MSGSQRQTITPQMLLQAYASGVFPMAESADNPEIFWVQPQLRGIFPLDGFHISRSLRRRMRHADYSVSVDTCFAEVVRACADRAETWINSRIFDLYMELHRMGYAHSVEVVRQGRLIGGVYGVALGRAFFGESMFSRETDASKIALANLVARLRVGGYILFDTQFLTPHLESLGAIEIPQADYIERLHVALEQPANFLELDPETPQGEVVHLVTQTS
jgi:leucyl/phenylalanyl-tRNA--protein transferase